MQIYRGNLELLDYVFFATVERGYEVRFDQEKICLPVGMQFLARSS